MKDRISSYPGRVKLTFENDNSVRFCTMELADAPSEEGTPLKAETLLSDGTASLLGITGEEATPDIAFNRLLQETKKVKPVSEGGTGKSTAPLAVYSLISETPFMDGLEIEGNDRLSIGDASSLIGKYTNLTELMKFIERNLKSSIITYGTTDLNAGSSSLATGTLYVVYE